MNTYGILFHTWVDECQDLSQPMGTDAATHAMLASIAAWVDIAGPDPAIALGYLARILEIAGEAADASRKKGM
jgi:hypothetical protein